MRGTRRLCATPGRALVTFCAALLCVFGAGPAAAMALAEPPPAAATPAQPAEPAEPVPPSAPAEGQPDPADPELRAPVRPPGRGTPVRQLPGAGVRVLLPPAAVAAPPGEDAYGAPGGGGSLRAVRSVVLRC
ncbi:hypothetical protein [Streptomyces bambusae]|uniref:Uncharacterized protein n=1 Tax=Streptomyces bambusae TaxID=1550616 RepID=A0ABS6Z3A0_9ACTN|nr:hypothetical protein [Streptomyces bambusae]MBW5482231.1 hypothetical protein [Streptomyces bambusae]